MLKVWTAADFAAREFESPPWLIEGLIPGRGISMIFTWGKVGKSIMSVQLAHALTTGNDFLGRKPVKQYKVLYYTSDLPEDEWGEQLKLLSKNDNWHTVWDMPGIFNSLSRKEDLQKIVKEQKFEIVVFDSLISCSEPAELNDLNAVRLSLRKLREITQDKPSWLIHHKRKGMPGVPDRSNVSAAGNFGLTAGVSTLIDLNPSIDGREGSIEVSGRYVRVSLDLKRGDNGLWLPKSKGDVFKKPGTFTKG